MRRGLQKRLGSDIFGPQHWNEAGLPIGTHIVGRWGDEATLFRLAGQLEQAKPWFDKAPAGY